MVFSTFPDFQKFGDISLKMIVRQAFVLPAYRYSVSALFYPKILNLSRACVFPANRTSVRASVFQKNLERPRGDLKDFFRIFFM